MRKHPVAPVFLSIMVASAAGAGGCGGGGGGDGDGTDGGGRLADGAATPGSGALANPASSGEASGIDLSTYPTRATLGTTGGTVVVPSGPVLTAPSGALATPVDIGMRPSAAAPVVGAPGYTVLSSWYDVATSQLDTSVKSASSALILDIPVAPPAAAIGHPGLQMIAMVDGIALPIEGAFDAATGVFRVELLGLPPKFSLAVAFNPNLQRISSDDPTVQLDTMPVGEDAKVVPWSTVDWWLVFDGAAVKMDGAKKILAWARAAATAYSNAGLKEPFLRKETVGDKPRWNIHLTTDGSYFGEGVAADRGLFGRQYMSVNRVASAMTDPLGSGQASVAHEMFHAVFRSYNIPALRFCNAAGDECRRSSSGFNEGMATSAGYWIDQGSPAKPRPNQAPRPLYWPFGWFSPDDGDTMYMNQDFYVYLLRVGTLANFRMHLEALASAVLPARGTLLEVLNAYDTALDAAPTGFGGNFTQTWAYCAADRGYVRTPDGWLWPTEPQGAAAGAQYVVDTSMFAAESNITFTKNDCTQGTNSLDCEVFIDKRYPLGPVLVTAKLDSLGLPSALVGKPLTGTFDAIVSGGNAVFTAFGEKNGKGSQAATVRSGEGLSVNLANMGTDYNTARMIVVPSGVPSAKMMVTMSFAGETAAAVWILCEGTDGAKESYGCIGWDGDNTMFGAGDECLFSGYMTDLGTFTTKAACTAKCTETANATAWRTCKTPG